MIRMEIACFMVIAFMAVMYLPVKREKTKLHKSFSRILIVSMLHILLDGITIYTVNKLDTVDLWLNNTFHRLFIATMVTVFYLVYYYVAILVADNKSYIQKIIKFAQLLFLILLVCIVVLPIKYIQTKNGNYSSGPVAYMAYAGVGSYIFLTVITLVQHWNTIYHKKKMAISIALAIEIIVSLYQAFHPLSLVSGMGIMLINLAFYLTLENPDIFLAQQVKEEKQKAEDANDAKSRFLSNMSHEIRTPMNAIVGMTEILLRTDLNKEQKEYLTNIKSSGNALVAIINDILDISKIEAGKMQFAESVYDFFQMLSDIRIVIQNQIGSKPIKLNFDIDKRIPQKLYGDGLRIRQILINLLNNAVKFTEAGAITLTIKIVECTNDAFRLFISSADTGQGIRQEDLNKLFGAFEQVDIKKNQGKEGTGLGLSISSQLIEMMGGKLSVKSEYGIGSEFFFTISQKLVTEETLHEEQDNITVKNFIAPDARILIVDDNEMNRKVAVGLLAPLKMNIDTADNGKKAIEMAQNTKYDIIFMDHMMPVMDGIEATKHLRALDDTYFKEIPIIALTANAMTEAKILFEEAGMSDSLTKPIEMKQMCATLLKWLPFEKIKEVSDIHNIINESKETESTISDDEFNNINGIDAREGIKNSGSKELFVSLLGDFYKLIDVKSNKIEKCITDNLIKDYTIEVHALKNTARMIGAMELSKDFAHLEELGNTNDINKIITETPEVLTFYRSYKPILKTYGIKQEEEKAEVSTEELIMYLEGMQEASESFDLDTIDAVMKKLDACKFPDYCFDLYELLRIAVADVTIEDISTTTRKLISSLNRKGQL